MLRERWQQGLGNDVHQQQKRKFVYHDAKYALLHLAS